MLITCENSVKLGIKGLFNLLSLISGDLENYFKNLIKNRKIQTKSCKKVF